MKALGRLDGLAWKNGRAAVLLFIEQPERRLLTEQLPASRPRAHPTKRLMAHSYNLLRHIECYGYLSRIRNTVSQSEYAAHCCLLSLPPSSSQGAPIKHDHKHQIRCETVIHLTCCDTQVANHQGKMYRPISETSADPLPATHNTTTISLYCNFNGWSIFDIPAKDRRLAVFLQDGHALDFIFLRWTPWHPDIRCRDEARPVIDPQWPCPQFVRAPARTPKELLVIAVGMTTSNMTSNDPNDGQIVVVHCPVGLGSWRGGLTGEAKRVCDNAIFDITTTWSDATGGQISSRTTFSILEEDKETYTSETSREGFDN
ncbi:hypothetical protein HL42_2688 [Trichophyton rubrum]|nr:hypothetical protein HL42_2688 [Trichophyton rubrum]